MNERDRINQLKTEEAKLEERLRREKNPPARGYIYMRLPVLRKELQSLRQVGQDVDDEGAIHGDA